MSAYLHPIASLTGFFLFANVAYAGNVGFKGLAVICGLLRIRGEKRRVQLITKPSDWEKTPHGLSRHVAAGAAPAAALRVVGDEGWVPGLAEAA